MNLCKKLLFSEFGSKIITLVKNFEVGRLSTKIDMIRIGRPRYDESN